MILVDENIPFIDVILSRHFNVMKMPGREINHELLKELNPICLITRSQTKINSNLIEGIPLKFIATATSGTDHVDLDYLKSRGIRFSDAIGSNATSVAEYALFSILHWEKARQISLEKKKIGIVGFGNIGKRLAHFAHSIGLEIFVNDPPLRDSGYIFPDYVKYVDLESLVTTCDIITNHIPLTRSGQYPTYQLFNKQLLNSLKDDILFIHTSRGGIVDENALLDLLMSADIQTVIDVWEKEPDFNCKLAEYSIIATPHIAGYSYDGKLNGVLMIIDAISKYFRKTFYVAPIEDVLSNNDKVDVRTLNKQQIYEKLLNNRLLLNDDEMLRSALSLDESDRARFFDLIRREYPSRREILVSPFDKFAVG